MPDAAHRQFACLASLAFFAALLPQGTVVLADQPQPAPVEVVRFQGEDGEQTLTGRILAEDTDGGVMLQTPNGVQHLIEAATVVSRERIEASFKPLTPDQLGRQVLEELPEGFNLHTTPHYVVCFNTSRAYAQWTSSLLERLHRAFTNYWENQGVEIHEPEFPLVVIIYATADQYRTASADELGTAAGSIIGYYSLTTNRVSMYDLTGSQALHGGGGRGSLRDINRMLAQPAALPLVATVVHEATHQIAFNCGLQQRLAELPLWLVEGMAVYFEAPDLSSNRGWRGIGKVNHLRLSTFKTNLHTSRRTSLLAMVADDKRFRDARTATNAYADAWALNYFLMRYHPDEYVAYVQAQAKKKPFIPVSAETRIEEFREHFGDIEELDREFVKRMGRID